MRDLPKAQNLFFCGIGGSGMLPLALICKERGCHVSGSDRAYDAGKTPGKFSLLKRAGIELFPQDGSGITEKIDKLIVSAAVENQIPDVATANEKQVEIQRRAELLAALFNDFKQNISIAGTSGKSTVTAMVATILEELGYDPTLMNGAIIRNFESAMRVGKSDLFITETDESDGSIALYNPAISVVNNIALDHKSFDELEELFKAFVGRTTGHVILNADDRRVMALQNSVHETASIRSFSITNPQADLYAEGIKPTPDGINFSVTGQNIHLQVPGRHNVANALAALCVAQALEIPLGKAIQGLEKFQGIKRRLETIGKSDSGVTIIDDFAHNPDKISASLKTLKTFSGRLFIFFQPHGFGPMRLMGQEIASSFSEYLEEGDEVCLTWPYYAGGTTEKDNTVQNMADQIAGTGIQSHLFKTREEFADLVLRKAESGDSIIIMGARDDTLSEFAEEILKKLNTPKMSERKQA